ncbi:MAG: hypothetical protein WC423_19090 [Vulcanimicrobiota bacterium]
MLIIVILTILVFGYVYVESGLHRKQRVVLAAVLHAVPAGIAFLLICDLGFGNSWFSGWEVASFLLQILCIAYLLFVGVTALLSSFLENFFPNPQASVFLSAAILFVCSIVGAQYMV